MVIVVRLDLDMFDLPKLSDLIRDGVVTITEASESKAFKAMSELNQLKTVRSWQAMKR